MLLPLQVVKFIGHHPAGYEPVHRGLMIPVNFGSMLIDRQIQYVRLYKRQQQQPIPMPFQGCKWAAVVFSTSHLLPLVRGS